MIYKNEDGSIYKIEKVDFEVDGMGSISPEICANGKSINEIIEVLHYLLKKTKHLPQETTELPLPDSEINEKS